MKYDVTLLVDATVCVTVEADSKEEALEKAKEEACAPSLCHQCSREIDIGDVLDADDDLERVYET